MAKGYGHKGQTAEQAMKAAEEAAERDSPWVDKADYRFDVN